jgi:hypothetical protein
MVWVDRNYRALERFPALFAVEDLFFTDVAFYQWNNDQSFNDLSWRFINSAIHFGEQPCDIQPFQWERPQTTPLREPPQ